MHARILVYVLWAQLVGRALVGGLTEGVAVMIEGFFGVGIGRVGDVEVVLGLGVASFGILRRRRLRNMISNRRIVKRLVSLPTLLQLTLLYLQKLISHSLLRQQRQILIRLINISIPPSIYLLNLIVVTLASKRFPHNRCSWLRNGISLLLRVV